MINQGLLENNVISLKFGRTEEEISELVLGGRPHNLSRVDLVEVPLDHSKASPSDWEDDMWRYYSMNGWQMSVLNMALASNTSGNPTPFIEIPQVTVIDSAFPWIGIPDNFADKIHIAIGIDRTFLSIDCDTRSHCPNWTITFGPGGNTITLTPWDFLLKSYGRYHKKLK